MRNLIDDIQALLHYNYDQQKIIIKDNVHPMFQKVIELKMKSEYARNISELQSIAFQLSDISINFKKLIHNDIIK